LQEIIAYIVLGSVGPQVQFAVVQETPHFIAVDKPPGVLVHPTKPGGPRTLWDELRGLLAYEIINGGSISILTRLDRETSGIVLVAKTVSAARELSLALRSGQIKKTYLAITFGWPDAREWTVNAPIRRLGEIEPFRVWLKRGVHAGGSPSITCFRVLHRFETPGGLRLSLIEASPKTGRTHQIRVHLAHSGFPIVGDKLYAQGEEWYLKFIEQGWTAEMENVLLLSRHALHASELEFTLLNKNYLLHSSLPQDFKKLLVNYDLSCRPL
jgi:23S rRNA pseudouridine1911/1915/1917 synthase